MEGDLMVGTRLGISSYSPCMRLCCSEAALECNCWRKCKEADRYQSKDRSIQCEAEIKYRAMAAIGVLRGLKVSSVLHTNIAVQYLRTPRYET